MRDHRLASTPSVDRGEVGELVELVEAATYVVVHDDDGHGCADYALLPDVAYCLRSLQAQVVRLSEALEQGAAWFDEYAVEHYSKAKNASSYAEQGSREDKGMRNKIRANSLRSVLSEGSRPDDEG